MQRRRSLVQSESEVHVPVHSASLRQARMEPDPAHWSVSRNRTKASTERWGNSHRCASINGSVPDLQGAGANNDGDFFRRERQASLNQMQDGNGSWDEYPQGPSQQLDVELDPDYDTSPEHLLKLFNILDKEQRGVITYDKLKMGLANLGTYSSLSYSVQRLGDELASEHAGGLMGSAHAHGAGAGEGITPQRFIQAVQEHAAKLYSAEDDEEGQQTSCFVYDYGPDALVCRWLQKKSEMEGDATKDPRNLVQNGVTLEQLLAEPKEPPQSVRWIAITGVEPGMVIRLCNKYGIHPLQIEDCLNPSKERLKVDTQSEGRKVTHVLLAKISGHTPCPGSPSHLQKEQVSVFLIDNNTVILIERSPSDLDDRLANRIMYRGSKLRLNNARYLVYSIVDALVDQVFPLMQHYHNLLVELQSQVHAESKTPLAAVKAIQQVNRDNHMLQYYLRPMKPVVAQLAQELPTDDDRELKRHLQDLYDHVMVLEELALRMITWSQSLNEDFRNEEQHRMNQVMYVLTMVTTAFLPAQFLTGVFGMNFEYMPELQWKYSYLVFWALVSTLAFTVFNFYRRLKWL